MLSDLNPPLVFYRKKATWGLVRVMPKITPGNEFPACLRGPAGPVAYLFVLSSGYRENICCNLGEQTGSAGLLSFGQHLPERKRTGSESAMRDGDRVPAIF